MALIAAPVNVSNAPLISQNVRGKYTCVLRIKGSNQPMKSSIVHLNACLIVPLPNCSISCALS